MSFPFAGPSTHDGLAPFQRSKRARSPSPPSPGDASSFSFGFGAGAGRHAHAHSGVTGAGAYGGAHGYANAARGDGQGHGFEALASPLEEVLIKRRKRDDNFGYFGHGHGHGHAEAVAGSGGRGDEEYTREFTSQAAMTGHHDGIEPVVPGIERRRNKLWASRNAPPSSISHGHMHRRNGGHAEQGGSAQDPDGYSMHLSPPPTSVASSASRPPGAPYTAPRHSHSHSHSHGYDGNDIAGVGSVASGEREQAHMMSSSPVRHEPPGSSPFKSSSQRTFVEDNVNIDIDINADDALDPVNGQQQDPDATFRLRASQRQRSRPGIGIDISHSNGIFPIAPAQAIEAQKDRGWDVGDMDTDGEAEMDMDMEELEREWGEYRGANSLLYQLHRARTTPRTERTRPTPSKGYTYRTPNHNDNHDPMMTPSHDSNDPHDPHNTAHSREREQNQNQHLLYGIETPVRPSPPFANRAQNGIQGGLASASNSAFVTPLPTRFHSHNNGNSNGNNTHGTHAPSPLRMHTTASGSYDYFSSAMPMPPPHTPAPGRQDSYSYGFGIPSGQNGQNDLIQPHADQRQEEDQNQDQDRFQHFRASQPHFPSSPFAPPALSGSTVSGSTLYPSSTQYDLDGEGDASSPLHGHGPGNSNDQASSVYSYGIGVPMPSPMQGQEQEQAQRQLQLDMQLEEQEATRRYEEMNRQLGEFAVARRERWGGGWEGGMED